MYDFSPACLYGEIILSKGYFRLAGVAVLRYKIAGIAGKHHVICLTLSA